jgi:hypothetical protein
VTVATIISEVRADGIHLALAPDGALTFKGTRNATNKWLPLLRQNKSAIVAHLARAQRTAWDAEDWQAHFNERAGIAEFDAGMTRPEAEARAYDACVSEWCNQHPVRSEASRCHWCSEGQDRGTVVPFGISPDLAWLHSPCWPAWHRSRLADAAEALAALGIAQRKDPGRGAT